MTYNKSQQRQLDELIVRVIELAERNYKCSQILIKLALEGEGKSNPDLIRSMAGLGDGCGFQNETCGLVTGAACLLAWYSRKDSDDEIPSETLLLMLQDLDQWFENEIGGNFKSTRCKDIVGELSVTQEGKLICGRLLLATHSKSNDILMSHGFK
jgi:hypothetical protein